LTTEQVVVNEIRESSKGDEEFFPKGAIAFFAAMIVGFGLTWLGIYFLLLYRQSWL
jgi:hypothetical protein